MEAATLRRGWLARLRTMRAYETLAWVAIAVAAYATLDGIDGSHDLGLLLFGGAGLAIRVAIATEWVRCDASGVTWRSGLLTREVPWDQIASIGIGPKLVRIIGGRRMLAPMLCLQIEGVAGGRPWRVTPSVWTPVMQQAEFIGAARLISPVEWGSVEPPGGRVRTGRGARLIRSMQRRGNGSRIGQPIPKRRVGPRE